MRNLTPVGRRLRRDSTPEEHKLWSYLRSRQCDGLKFRRQHPLAGYVLDFYCEELKLRVELDGSQHGERVAQDKQRTAALARLGVTVIRFWNAELKEPDFVWQRVQDAIATLRAR